MEILEYFLYIEDLSEEEEEIIKIERIILLESSSIILIDFEDDRLDI